MDDLLILIAAPMPEIRAATDDDIALMYSSQAPQCRASSFDARYEQSELHVKEVQVRLEAEGYKVSPHGIEQCYAPEVVRELAQTGSLMRSRGDLLAVRAPLEVKIIECKSGRSDTNYYCIPTRSVEAVVIEAQAWSARALIVWPDFMVSFAREVVARCQGVDTLTGDDGSHFWLIPKSSIRRKHLPPVGELN